MRKTLGALALAALTLLGSGCKKGPPIVGKWTMTQGKAGVDIEFKPENTFTMAIKPGGFEYDLSGDYKLEGENLTLTFKDVNVPKLSPAQQTLAKAQVASQMGKPQPLNAKFPTDDQLILSATGATPSVVGKSTTLTRVKDAK